jgi:hypothetical protein
LLLPIVAPDGDIFAVRLGSDSPSAVNLPADIGNSSAVAVKSRIEISRILTAGVKNKNQNCQGDKNRKARFTNLKIVGMAVVFHILYFLCELGSRNKSQDFLRKQFKTNEIFKCRTRFFAKSSTAIDKGIIFFVRSKKAC